MHFIFQGEEFELKGKIIRRKDHIKGKSVTYGVQFVDLSVNDIKRLNVSLNNYQMKQGDGSAVRLFFSNGQTIMNEVKQRDGSDVLLFSTRNLFFSASIDIFIL